MEFLRVGFKKLNIFSETDFNSLYLNNSTKKLLNTLTIENINNEKIDVSRNKRNIM